LKVFNPEEAYFIRQSLRDGLTFLHEDRRKATKDGDLVRLMRVEDEIAIADEAVSKMKGFL
jgi:hypothetical protein